MVNSPQEAISDRLKNEFQRDFPLVAEPYADIAGRLGCKESDVRAACRALIDSGVVARVGGVVQPNTIGASTLAAVSVPELATDSAARAISGLDGINHVYLRENAINIWFVATGPDRAFVDAKLRDVERLCGQPVLDLRLEKSFHIDLGFPLDGGSNSHEPRPQPTIGYLSESCDRNIVQALTSGLRIVPRPFAAIGEELGLSEEVVIARLRHLVKSGVVSRIGVIVRHRALGWCSNAMVVWDVDPAEMGAKARMLSAHQGINLCYSRRRYDKRWPYNLYCMVHAKSREQALQVLETASASAGLESCPRQVLFSSRCYKQTGALIATRREAA